MHVVVADTILLLHSVTEDFADFACPCPSILPSHCFTTMPISKRGRSSCGATRSRPYPRTRGGAVGSGHRPSSETNPDSPSVHTTQPPTTDQFLQWIQAAVQQQISALATVATPSSSLQPVSQPQLVTPLIPAASSSAVVTTPSSAVVTASSAVVTAPSSAVVTAPPYGEFYIII